jgi:hypothetical protein
VLDHFQENRCDCRFGLPRPLLIVVATGFLLGVAALATYGDVRLFSNDRGYAPTQPIAFSHRVHAGDLKIDCMHCHTGVERSRAAGVPSQSICMNCHRFVQASSNDLRVEEAAAAAESRVMRPVVSRELRTLFRAAGLGENGKPDSTSTLPPSADIRVGGGTASNPGAAHPIAWTKVHDLPDFVYFNHARHVNGGVACASCHGPVETMERVRQVENFSMGFCVNCHRDENVKRGKREGERGWASLDCSSCHI